MTVSHFRVPVAIQDVELPYAPSAAAQARFLSKVRIEGDCWIWCAYVNEDGYAQFWTDGSAKYGHRVAWSWAFGPIPEELEADHLCTRRSCVNPGHVELVPHVENLARTRRRMERWARVG
jgi:hypothetical protein